MPNLSSPTRMVLAGLLLATPACSSGDATPPAAVETDSAGVLLVESPAVDRPLEATPEVHFTLGGGESAHDAFFRAGPWNVALDGEGRIHVLDLDAHQLHRFDASGEYLRTLAGRRGSGPGEIQFAAGLSVDPEGGLWVVDLARQAFVRFGPDGELLPEEPLPEGFNGGILRWTSQGIVATTRDPQRNARLVVDPLNGDPPVELASIPAGELRSMSLTSCGMGFSGMPPIFSPTLTWAASGDRVVVNRGGGYVLDVYEQGRHVRSLRRGLEPRPATEALAVASLGEGMRVQVDGRQVVCDPAEVVEQQGFAAWLPAFRHLTMTPDGSVWAERYEVGDTPGPVDLFGPDGHYRGTYPAGSPIPLDVLPDGRFIWTGADALGVERVMVGRFQERVPADAHGSP